MRFTEYEKHRRNKDNRENKENHSSSEFFCLWKRSSKTKTTTCDKFFKSDLLSFVLQVWNMIWSQIASKHFLLSRSDFIESIVSLIENFWPRASTSSTTSRPKRKKFRTSREGSSSFPTSFERSGICSGEGEKPKNFGPKFPVITGIVQSSFNSQMI